MIDLNLEIRIDSNLRDYALVPQDMHQALKGLENQLLEMTSTNDPSKKIDQINLLGRIGNYQRILGLLNQAEMSFKKAISLSEENSQLKLVLVNQIRLAHTWQWMQKYLEAHDVFDKCLLKVETNSELNEYLDFIYQHKAKCFFDQNQYQQALSFFYKAHLLRVGKGDLSLVESSLQSIEVTKNKWLPQVPLSKMNEILSDQKYVKYLKKLIQPFADEKLFSHRINCINAALNFHDFSEAQVRSLKPFDLLSYLMKETEQILNPSDYQIGDLVVWWNRSQGSWDNKSIIIKNINFQDSDFPYGLIFDHVAIRIDQNIVFNKPNPSPSTVCKFDYFETASYPSKLGHGYEVTYHRVIP